MNLRYGLPLAAVLVLGATPAFAGPKPKPQPTSCLLVTDDTGDAAQAAGPSSDALDIVSGDVGSGAKNLVVVLRLKSFAIDTMTTTGASYDFAFNVGAAQQKVQLTRYSDGTGAATYDADTSTATGTSVNAVPVAYILDTSAATITWLVSRKTVPQLATKGVKFTGLAATARPSVNNNLPGASGSLTVMNGDSASSPKGYVDSTPTCVKGV
jgi:hypothetical protein